MRTWICPALVLLSLTGCSAPEGSPQEGLVPARPVTSIVSDTVTRTFQGAWAAALTPLEDLNLKRQEIPEKLQKIADNPYAVPPQMLCEGIRKEIAELDTLLGPDVCTPQNPTGMMVSKKGEYIEQGIGMARQKAIGLVEAKTNVIPFRGLVRKVTGADRYAKEVERAYEAGKLRRAFMKGLGNALGKDCLTPTAEEIKAHAEAAASIKETEPAKNQYPGQ